MPSPFQNGGPQARPSSPVSGRSTLITSAPSADEDLRAVRSGDRRRHVEHAHVLQGLVRHAANHRRSALCDDADDVPRARGLAVSGRVVELPGSSSASRCSTRSSRRAERDGGDHLGVLAGSGDLSLAALHPCAPRPARSSATTSRTGSATGSASTPSSGCSGGRVAPGFEWAERSSRSAARTSSWSPASSRADGPPRRSRPATFVVLVAAVLRADAVAGLIWGTTTMLGYIGGKAFEERPGRAC